MWGTQNWLWLWQKAHQGWTLHQSKMPICFTTWYEWCFPPFACIERKWTGGEWWLCLHVKVTLGNSLARQKLAWLFSKRSHWPQDIWVKMDSISVSLLQTLYANSTLCKCVVFVYSKRGGFKCLCPLEPLHSLWIALSQLAQLYSCAIVVRVAWVSRSTLTLWAVLENLWKPRREVIS